MPNVIQSRIQRKARKEHECNECGMPITKGTIYSHEVLKMDYIYSWKMHLDCMHLTFSRPDQWNPFFGEERQNLAELWNEYKNEISSGNTTWDKAMIEKFRKEQA